MYIPSYQMHNVLNVYSRRLGRQRRMPASESSGGAANDRISISNAAKRQAIVERVASDIIDRIKRFGPSGEFERYVSEKLNEKEQADDSCREDGATQFVFNVIDDNQEKTTNTLSAADARALMQRMDQLAKAAALKSFGADCGSAERTGCKVENL